MKQNIKHVPATTARCQTLKKGESIVLTTNQVTICNAGLDASFAGATVVVQQNAGGNNQLQVEGGYWVPYHCVSCVVVAPKAKFDRNTALEIARVGSNDKLKAEITNRTHLLKTAAQGLPTDDHKKSVKEIHRLMREISLLRSCVK